MDDSDKQYIIWEAPKIIPPEFRLYYDESGRVICYTCEKLEGNYIVIDSQTFAESRPDIRVVDGIIVKRSEYSIIAKLTPDEIEGKSCAIDDISVVVDENENIKTLKWKLTTNEFR